MARKACDLAIGKSALEKVQAAARQAGVAMGEVAGHRHHTQRSVPSRHCRAFLGSEFTIQGKMLP